MIKLVCETDSLRPNAFERYLELPLRDGRARLPRPSASRNLPPDEQRCRRNDGKSWRCRNPASQGSTLCEQHRNAVKRKGSKPAAQPNLQTDMLDPEQLVAAAPVEDLQMHVSTQSSRENAVYKRKRAVMSNSEKHSIPHQKKLAMVERKAPGIDVTPGKTARIENGGMPHVQRLAAFYKEQLSPINQLKATTFEPGPFEASASCQVAEAEKRRGKPLVISSTQSATLDKKYFARQSTAQDRDDDEPPTTSVGKKYLKVRGLASFKGCHQCQREDKLCKYIICKKCWKRSYCSDCICKWYHGMSEDEFQKACACCQRKCNCKVCLWRKESPRIRYLLYMLKLIIPAVEKLYNDQYFEIKLESKQRKDPNFRPERAIINKERLYCNNCSTSIPDVHWACPQCQFELCLVCIWELRAGKFPGYEQKMEIHGLWKPNADMTTPCPPVELGGCASSNLVLKRIFNFDWLKRIIRDSQNLTESCPRSPKLCHECPCEAGWASRLAASRITRDNNIYCPTADDLKSIDIAHFQKHWQKGEPVIVRDVLKATKGSIWTVDAIKKAFHGCCHREGLLLKTINCLYCTEVEISIDDFFDGYKHGPFYDNSRPLMLKLKDWPPNALLKDMLPQHEAEFIRALPVPEYTAPDPTAGVLNLAAKFPTHVQIPDLGPKMYIASGLREELGEGNSVTKLHYDLADAVNVLIQTSPYKLGEEHRRKLANEPHLSKEKADKKQTEGTYGGALWDIFRREDVTKLKDYILKHFHQFRHMDNEYLKEIGHPIHDQSIYLTEDHKKSLKHEFGIEAWTFEQHEGEAVFIPAGCPHQVRNLKSCIKVASDFVSPESVEECIKLADEIRSLQKGHFAREDKLEVRKMILYAARHAIKQIQAERSVQNGNFK